MIYKRLNVTALPLRAGQIVGAPLSPMALRNVDGPLVAVDQRQVKLRYSGFVGPFACKSDPMTSAHAYRKLASDLGAGIDWDCSSKVFVTLRGVFHSPVMVMREAWTFGSKLHYISDSPRAIMGAKNTVVTLGIEQAYMLLGDVLFTGEIEYHNTVADRTAPFKWPFLTDFTSDMLASIYPAARTAQADWAWIDATPDAIADWKEKPDQERPKPVIRLTLGDGLAQLITVLFTDGEEVYPLSEGHSILRSMHCSVDSLRLTSMVSKEDPSIVLGSASDAWDVMFEQPGNPYVRFAWHDMVQDSTLAAITSPYIFIFLPGGGSYPLPVDLITLNGSGDLAAAEMRGEISLLLPFAANPASALVYSAAEGTPVSIYRIDPLQPKVQ